jgi:hypothetical protein
LAVRRGLWWCSVYSDYDRQWKHRSFDAKPGIDGPLPSADELMPLKVTVAPGKGEAFTDDQLDELDAMDAHNAAAAAAGEDG